jgi:hypothetical protein
MNIIHNEFDVRLFADTEADISVLQRVREQAITGGIGQSSVGVAKPVMLEGAVIFLILDCELVDVQNLLRSVGVNPQSIPITEVKIEEEPKRKEVR